MLSSGTPQALALAADWGKVRETPAWRAQPELFSEINQGARSTAPSTAEEDAEIRRELKAAPPAAREALILEKITERAAAVLGIADVHELSPHRALSELGVDSFAATELVQRIAGVAGRSLSPTIVFQYPTLAALAGFIGQSLSDPLSESAPLQGLPQVVRTRPEAPRPSPLAAPFATSDDEALLSEIAEMETDEVQDYLRQFLESQS
jgi:acyl carrier protein